MDAEGLWLATLGCIERGLVWFWFDLYKRDMQGISYKKEALRIGGPGGSTREWLEDCPTNTVRSQLMGTLNRPVVVVLFVVDKGRIGEEGQTEVVVRQSTESRLEVPVIGLARPLSAGWPDTHSNLAQDSKTIGQNTTRAFRIPVEAGYVANRIPTHCRRMHMCASTDRLAPLEHIGIQRKSLYKQEKSESTSWERRAMQ